MTQPRPKFFNFPAVGTAQKLAGLLTKMERELGLTPASRERLGRVYQNFDSPDAWEEDRKAAERAQRYEEHCEEVDKRLGL